MFGSYSWVDPFLYSRSHFRTRSPSRNRQARTARTYRPVDMSYRCAVNLVVPEMPCSITDRREHLPASLPRPCPEPAKTSREITNETLAARLPWNARGMATVMKFERKRIMLSPDILVLAYAVRANRI
jgi:hypothetical protein